MKYNRRALRQLRLAKGYHRDEMAKRAKVAPRTISHLERYGEPRASTLAKLATALEAPITAFFQETKVS